MRKQFEKSVKDLATQDENTVVLIGDISHHLLKEYEQNFPNRFYNLGICEQSLVGLASGMALKGMKPIVHTIAPFCVERAYEQIKIDLCYQKTDVTIISVGSSFDYSHLGCTHHCYEDVAILRALPNMQVFVPGNSKEFDSLLKETWGNGYPKYFKLSNKEHKFNFNVSAFRHVLVQEGSGDTVVVVNGHLLEEVMESVDPADTVIYLPTLSFLLQDSIVEIGKIINNKKVLIVEENSLVGGLSDLIFDISCSENATIKSKKIGIPTKFLTNYGKPEEHRAILGLTTANIKKTIDNW